MQAICELLEAKAELLREESATLGLGTYARAYREGQEDLMSCDCGCIEGAEESHDPS